VRHAGAATHRAKASRSGVCDAGRGLNAGAISPNKLWHTIFQQAASYPGRDDPNLAIAG